MNITLNIDKEAESIINNSSASVKAAEILPGPFFMGIFDTVHAN